MPIIKPQHVVSFSNAETVSKKIEIVFWILLERAVKVYLADCIINYVGLCMFWRSMKIGLYNLFSTGISFTYIWK